MADNTIYVYTLTSSLHDETAVDRISREFLDSSLPAGGYVFRGSDFSAFGKGGTDLIFVRTGGTEGIFKALMDEGRFEGVKKFHLLTSGKSNSLAASMEILSYLRQNGLEGEILHGGGDYIKRRVEEISAEVSAPAATPLRLGVVGRPSDWLIASNADRAAVRKGLGVELVDIGMDVLLDKLAKMDAASAGKLPCGIPDPSAAPAPKVAASIPGAERIYLALKEIVDEYRLGGLTLRCFDLLGTVHNTGCLALARLNSEGFPSSCEGDVPALLSMLVAKRVTGRTGFQANPSRIDPETGEMLFAHCTIPFDMVDAFSLDTHYESGIGVGIRGHFPEGPVTVFKLSGDLRRCFAAEGELVRNQAEADLCRTQVVVRLRPEDARYFLTDPIGNHHIIVPGHCAEALRKACGQVGSPR